jgi:hypothetical protein
MSDPRARFQTTASGSLTRFGGIYRVDFGVGFGGGGVGHGTGSGPMATSAGFCPAKVGVPPTIRRMETHVKTTSNARRNVKTKFFI